MQTRLMKYLGRKVRELREQAEEAQRDEAYTDGTRDEFQMLAELLRQAECVTADDVDAKQYAPNAVICGGRPPF